MKAKDPIATCIDDVKEIRKTINVLYDDIEDIQMRIKQARAMFRSIRYSIAECVLTEEEIDHCLTAFMETLDELEHFSLNRYSMSIKIEGGISDDL